MFLCEDCETSTLNNYEYYMVKNEIWKTFGVGDGFLCIGCLENRIQRQLTSSDFTDCPLNKGYYEDGTPVGIPQSERLLNRLNK